MPVVISADVEQFAAAAGTMLASRPVHHNVPLTVLEGLRRGTIELAGGEIFGWFVDPSGAVRAAAHYLPPNALLLTDGGEEWPVELAAALAARDVALPGVIGPLAVTTRFAQQWSSHTGCRHTERMREWIYQLDRLVSPSTPPGAARLAEPDEAELIVGWLGDFEIEAGLRPRPLSVEVISKRIAARQLWVWVDGRPTALAGTNWPIEATVRIGPVYTSPADRGRGYGRALTAAACAAVLAGGADRCMLYADQANPVSNAIYQQIGFARVGEVVEYDLG